MMPCGVSLKCLPISSAICPSSSSLRASDGASAFASFAFDSCAAATRAFGWRGRFLVSPFGARSAFGALGAAAFALVLPDLVYATWMVAEPFAYPLALAARVEGNYAEREAPAQL